MKMKEQNFGDNSDDYDKRSSVFVSRGDNHGVGYNQPVGSEKGKPCKEYKSFEKNISHK